MGVITRMEVGGRVVTPHFSGQLRLSPSVTQGGRVGSTSELSVEGGFTHCI